MVKLLKRFKFHLRPAGTSQFSLANREEQEATSEKSAGEDSAIQNQVAVPSCGWDGSSVVLVGYKRYKPINDDPFFVAVNNESFKTNLMSSPLLNSSNFVEDSSIAAVESRDVDQLVSNDSAVASCILAYSEDFGGAEEDLQKSSSASTSSHKSSQPTSSIVSSSASPRSPPSYFADASFDSSSPLTFPEAISALFPPVHLLSRHDMETTPDRYERSTTGRRMPGGHLDLKRRTSSIQPFPSAFRVLLESGETRSFRYDSETTVSDILGQLQEKLGISVVQHFGFVLRRASDIVFVLPETMKISEFVDWCAANEYECSLRVVFPPKQPEDFMATDPVAFNYLYNQCTNDVLSGRFEHELGVDKAIYLSALHILQFAIASNLSGKLTTRRIDKEFGLEHFIPAWVRERGRGRTVEHAVSESLRHLTERQRGAGQQNYKMQYVKLLSLMAEYGAHAFPAILLGFTEEKCSLLLGPNCGISYLPATLTQTKPVFLIRFEHIRCIELDWSGQNPTNITCNVHHVIKDITPTQFLLPRWLKDSFLFVIRRYRRLLVSNSAEVTIIEINNGMESAPGKPTSISKPPEPTPKLTSSINSNDSNAKAQSPKGPIHSYSNYQEAYHSLSVRNNEKHRQALLQLTIAQQSSTLTPKETPSSCNKFDMKTPRNQNHLLLAESSSCPNINGIVSHKPSQPSTEPHPEIESGIGSEMDSPRSHPPLISPPTSSDGTDANHLLEMRFEPPPGFGDSDDDSGKFVVDNPLCYDNKSASNDEANDFPPPPASKSDSSRATSRTQSIDDIVASFNMALKGTLGLEEDPVSGQTVTVWSPTCSLGGAILTCDSNIVTVSLVDDMPPPPPELNESSVTVDSFLFPPSECAPPPPPPYPFPLPGGEKSDIQNQTSSDSGNSEELSGSGEQPLSPLPPPVLLAINNLPSDQLNATITRILTSRKESDVIDTTIQLSCIMSESSALRFSLSVFGAQDLTSPDSYGTSEISEENQINLSSLDELSDKLVHSCRGVLTAVGEAGKSAFKNAANDAVVGFAETSKFLLDYHRQNRDNNQNEYAVYRLGQLSSALTHALDAFNCCLQTGLLMVDEQSNETAANESSDGNERLKQLLLNAAWLARSLAVFCSLSVQMNQEALAGESSSDKDEAEDGKEEKTLEENVSKLEAQQQQLQEASSES